MSNFIQDCINGDAILSEIDNYIEEWHNSDSDMDLHSFLGMSTKEYALYLQDEAYLASIIKGIKENVQIEIIIDNQLAMAARSDSQQKAIRLKRWLESEGLWD